MYERTDIVICDGCGVEISWAPIVEKDRQYCCHDCQQDRPCKCGSRMDEEDDHRKGISTMLDAGGRV